MYWLRSTLVALAILNMATLSANAGYCDNRVGTALVLAIDDSSSIKSYDWAIEKGGYVAAFRHADIQEAILTSVCGRIAVTAIHWSGRNEQKQVIPWQILDDKKSIENFATSLDAMNRTFEMHTSIAAAIKYSVGLFDSLPYEAINRVIDISGDGIDWNDRQEDGVIPIPPYLEYERNKAHELGITINGLAIDARESWTITDVYTYYKDRVQTPDGFVVRAESFEDFPRAILEKLKMEIM